MPKYLISHDLGTSGNKASLFSTEGELICSYTAPYEVNFFGQNCAEQNPEDWWNAVCLATKKVLEKMRGEDIVAISFSSQMQACVLVDKSGNALRPAIIWADTRAEKQKNILAGKLGEDTMYSINGHRASASYSIEKLMWVRDHEPDIFSKAYKMLLAKDYIICRLTGEFVTDYSEASGTDAFDLKTRAWSEKVLEAAQISVTLMPEIHYSTDAIGSLRKEVAEELGLKRETAVICGGGDGVCAALGAGCIEDGQTFMSMGTSAWIARTTDEMFLDLGRNLICFAHVIPGKYMPCGSMQAAGSSHAYIKDILLEDVRDASESFGKLDQLIKESPAGAKGLIFLPYMLGERTPRWNTKATGSFLGIRMDHEKADYARAVLEGVAMNMRLIMDVHREKEDAEEILLTGGGARGDVFSQILADVIGIPMSRLNHVENATSIAAAIIAGVGVGVFSDFSVADQFVTKEYTFFPRQEYREVYDRQIKLFEEGYQCLRPFYEDEARDRTRWMK